MKDPSIMFGGAPPPAETATPEQWLDVEIGTDYQPRRMSTGLQVQRDTNRLRSSSAPDDRTGDQTNKSLRTSRSDRDLMSEIISDLAEDCDSAFSRPSSVVQPRSSRHSFSSRELRQEDIEEIRPYSISNTPTMTSAMDPQEARKSLGLETSDFQYPYAGKKTEKMNDHDDWSPISLQSYRTSLHSGFSRPPSSGVDGSTVSLFHAQRDKRMSTKSHLREAQSAYDRPSSSGSETQQDEPPQEPPEQVYPSKPKVIVIMFSLYISIFLVALDRTIMGPAIPAITNEFKSVDDIGWYGSSYMLTSAGFILLYGRIYTFFPTKPVFLSGIFLFEVGSAICGAAQSSIMLILGRAIAGLGSSGIFTGAILIMLSTVPLHRRPMLQGLFGACFGMASVAGPLLGGAFTGSSATWRWCFYINLPLGALTIAAVVFLLHVEENKPKLATWMETFKQMDPVGFVLFLPSITCLLLALEWGAEMPWSSPQIIACLTVFSILFLAFIGWQYYTRHTTATVPSRIVLQRSVACGGFSQFCVGSTMLTVSIYIPLWFQAIKGVSAMQSGINTIPLVLSVVVASIVTGGLVQRFGYYTPFMILGSILMAIGTGLLTTWNVGISTGAWVAFEIIIGLGVGATMQHPNIAVQTVLPKQDVPVGTAVLSLCQTLGGAVFTAVGQNLYIDKFSSGLEAIGGIDVEHVLDGGATSLKTKIPAELLEQALRVYNNALTRGTFTAALIVACLALPAALGMEWRSVKEKQGPQGPQPRKSQDEEKQQPPPMSGHRRQNSENQPRPGTANSESFEDEPLMLPPPPNAWKRLYRSSGQFSSYMTAKVNPDLRGDLKSRN